MSDDGVEVNVECVAVTVIVDIVVIGEIIGAFGVVVVVVIVTAGTFVFNTIIFLFLRFLFFSLNIKRLDGIVVGVVVVFVVVVVGKHRVDIKDVLAAH